MITKFDKYILTESYKGEDKIERFYKIMKSIVDYDRKGFDTGVEIERLILQMDMTEDELKEVFDKYRDDSDVEKYIGDQLELALERLNNSLTEKIHLKDVTSERPNVMPAPQGLGIPNVSNNISSEYYTIGDLKKFINDLPDETPVIISNPVGRGSNEDAHDAFYLKNVYMDEKGYAFMRGSETPPIDGFEIVQGLVVYGD